jgi:adenine/guanine phosphoribosyltransferase-like PRPP-binding protein
MPLRAVILDLDGTLLEPRGDPVHGAPEMVGSLAQHGLKIVVASNQPGATQKLARAGISPDLLLDRDVVGSSKGTPAWVDRACAEFGIERHELVWLGDGDLDMRSAVNAKVAYFNAGWSAPDFPYGIHMDRPELFGMVISECFAKPIDWFAWLDGTDQARRPVTVRAMTDSRGGGSPTLEGQLRRFLKERQDFRLGPYDFGVSVTMHLFGSIYGSGIPQAADTWTIYPGSKRASGPNASLVPFMTAAARLFRGSYVPDLLIRHTDALDSGQTRYAGQCVGFSNQINTMQLNPAQRKRITGKRVVVVDDFETDGNSLECARNLLLQAGAAAVTCISIGKYNMKNQGISRNVLAPSDGYDWDPYAPTIHVAEDFRGGPQIVRLNRDEAAPSYFRDSLNRIGRF